MTTANAIEQYLRSGDYDPSHASAGGGDWLEKAKNGRAELLSALINAVKSRSHGRPHHPVPQLDLPAWTRRKVTPMVHGFFAEAERESVLRLFESSVVFLTHDNIEPILARQTWLHSAWTLANLFLASVGAELLGPDAPSLLGLSEEVTCYVSTEYFARRDRIEDFVLHEAAHVFHNCKRTTAGLPETRAKEWLLPVDFGKRETFAYSCEAYGLIVERASRKAERRALAERFVATGFGVCDDEMDPREVADIVREACEAGNGWRVILRRCAPERRARSGGSLVA